MLASFRKLLKGRMVPRKAPFLKIPRSMSKMPLVGGTGHALLNSLMGKRGLNSGLQKLDEEVNSEGTDQAKNKIARSAPGLSKGGIFG